jgi:ribonuclease HII
MSETISENNGRADNYEELQINEEDNVNQETVNNLETVLKIEEDKIEEEKPKKKRKRQPPPVLKIAFDSTPGTIEVGIDEAGRGCLSGRVYVGAVVLPREIPDDPMFKQIRDSKKISRKKRAELRKYIEKIAVAYHVAYAEPDEIDDTNILVATLKTMHRALDGIKEKFNFILVDGNQFRPYISKEGEMIPHHMVKGGDNIYYSIAAASILAKEYHDDYVKELCHNNPEMKIYDWENNMCYGSKKHRDAIAKYGITKYHRRTFGICKEFV